VHIQRAAKFLMERPDLPIERVAAYKAWTAAERRV
jgi:hypothetical protein